MILVAMAWIYVVLMVAVVEATGPQGSVLGACVTFGFYGVLPLAIVTYLMLSPARRRARRAREAAAGPVATGSGAGAGPEPDDGSHPPGEAVAPVGKET